jgi:hypothetical protein
MVLVEAAQVVLLLQVKLEGNEEQEQSKDE